MFNLDFLFEYILDHFMLCCCCCDYGHLNYYLPISFLLQWKLLSVITVMFS